MLMGGGVAGGTQINATNGLVEAIDVSVSGSDLIPDGGSVRMTASHVHRELRRYAGILNNELAMEFPIDAEDLPILG
jgi:hypothetical protein